MAASENARDAAAILDVWLGADGHGRVISVDRDSILFLGDADAGAYTAWLNTPRDQPVRVALVQDGFVAEEPAGLHAPA